MFSNMASKNGDLNSISMNATFKSGACLFHTTTFLNYISM